MRDIKRKEKNIENIIFMQKKRNSVDVKSKKERQCEKGKAWKMYKRETVNKEM